MYPCRLRSATVRTKVWKLIGFVTGLLLRGPIGAILGLLAGWWLDSLSGGGGWRPFQSHTQAQEAFFRALFGAMGHIAKADGRVSEREIAVAEQSMRQLGVRGRQRRRAIEFFRAGKRRDFPLERELEPFARMARNQPSLKRLFVEILLNAALADGRVSAEQRALLKRILGILGLPATVLDELLRRRGAGARQSTGGAGRRSAGRATPAAGADPYRVLGVQRSASNDEVKKAYRRLMARYHPDKLVARGLPAEMRDYAHTKVREVRAAYDSIREARGFR